MSRADERLRNLRRVDVKLAVGLTGAIGTLLIVVMAIFFFVSLHDTVEILDGILEGELAATATSSENVTSIPPHPSLGHHDPIAIRRIDPAGRSEILRGDWPVGGRRYPAGTSSLRLAVAAGDAQLFARRDLARGGRLEAVLSLRQFAEERREQIGRILVSLGISAIGLIAIAIIATRLALAPLRAATQAVECIDERHLDGRLAVRGTGDDMDRHALALNRVLQRLEDAFRRMSAFSADVAHELRTPVNRMLNIADVAILRHGEAEPAADLARLREAAEHMRRLIDNLLLLAKGEEGRLALRREPVSLTALAADLVELFRPSCEERGIDLSLVVPPEDCTVLGDQGLLQRALSNLLDNAVRHTPEGGKIAVSIAQLGADAEIAVADSGKGISAADCERVFHRFVQLDEARSSDGMGLGLALVRMIARSQGGEVAADTSKLGGALLRVRLPLASACEVDPSATERVPQPV